MRIEREHVMPTLVTMSLGMSMVWAFFRTF